MDSKTAPQPISGFFAIVFHDRLADVGGEIVQHQINRVCPWIADDHVRQKHGKFRRRPCRSQLGKVPSCLGVDAYDWTTFHQRLLIHLKYVFRALDVLLDQQLHHTTHPSLSGCEHTSAIAFWFNAGSLLKRSASNNACSRASPVGTAGRSTLAESPPLESTSGEERPNTSAAKPALEPPSIPSAHRRSTTRPLPVDRLPLALSVPCPSFYSISSHHSMEMHCLTINTHGHGISVSDQHI